MRAQPKENCALADEIKKQNFFFIISFNRYHPISAIYNLEINQF
jgi:hypothetical protein